MHALYQRLRELDWDTFQRLAFQILAARHPGLELRHADGSGGDRGIDLFVGQLDNHPTIWQCKHFPNRLGPRQRPQVTESLRTAIKWFEPARWILVISTDLDMKAHEWFQKLQKAYAGRCWIGLFQASDIVRELIQRRTIRDAFFPGAVMDTITMKRALRDRDQDTEEHPDEMIARAEEADARFDYRIVYGPNLGTDITRQAPGHPLHVASVLGEEKRIDVFARDLKALRLDPPRVTFAVTSAGLDKMNAFLRTGRAQELDHDEVSSATSTFDFLLPEHTIAGWRIMLLPSPDLQHRVIPLRLTFAKDDVRVEYGYVPFRVVRAGTEEAEIESTAPLPFVLSLTLPSATGHQATWECRYRVAGANVREAAKAIKAVSLLRAGGTLELYALDAGEILGTIAHAQVTTPSQSHFAAVVLGAAAVAEAYHVELCMPDRITNGDLKAINLLQATLVGRTMSASRLHARLVKSQEHEANINPSIAQALQVISRSERLEPRPVVFGVPIDTGPIALIASGARIERPATFLRAYQNAKYGDSVPIGFRVRRVRIQRVTNNAPHLLVKPEA